MVANWEGSIVSFPMVVVRPKTAEEIAAIIGNTDDYPSPVRAVGSNHSTTHCGVADKGTLIEMSAFQDVRIDKQNMTVTAGAGALYIDVAHKLAQENLQFYVNVELGNLSVGSAACGGTKDASMPGDDEYGQVSSYAIGMKIVEPDCNLGEVSEADGDRLKMMRSSYGLLGIIYEATFRVRAMEPLAVRHKTYRLGEFQDKFNGEILNNKDESMMLYLFPFLNRITVEFRRYDRDGAVGKIDTFLWTLRNWVWKLFAPAFGHYVTKFVPIIFLRYLMIDWFNRLIVVVLNALAKPNTAAHNQIILYPP